MSDNDDEVLAQSKLEVAESKLEVGMKVEANYRGKGKYYKGKIAKENRDGTFDIDYDDGEYESRMEAMDIRSLEKGGGGGGGGGGTKKDDSVLDKYGDDEFEDHDAHYADDFD
jgi:hypothetical protein